MNALGMAVANNYLTERCIKIRKINLLKSLYTRSLSEKALNLFFNSEIVKGEASVKRL